ncbi:Gfo/Idh/MocA family protein [Paenibacillus tundrae]
MKKLKMAVIGLGKMGLHMIHQAKNEQHVEVVAVCDSNEQSLADYVASNPETSTYTDYRLLLDEHEIDLVYVAVPPKYHYGVVMEVLQRGIHIFCEKPLANSVGEAEAMLAAAEQSGVLHAIHFSMPHEPAVLQLQKLIQEGNTLGTIRKIELILQFPQWPRAWQQNSWITTRDQGGFILEVGIHWIHVIQTVFGGLNVINSQVQYPDQSNGCETEIHAEMQLQDGTRVEMNGISHFAGEERVSMVVYGTKGTIALENWDQLMIGRVGESLTPVTVDESLSELPVLKHVIARIQDKPGKIYDFKAGLEAQRILEALRSK